MQSVNQHYSDEEIADYLNSIYYDDLSDSDGPNILHSPQGAILSWDLLYGSAAIFRSYSVILSLTMICRICLLIIDLTGPRWTKSKDVVSILFGTLNIFLHLYENDKQSHKPAYILIPSTVIFYTFTLAIHNPQRSGKSKQTSNKPKQPNKNESSVDLGLIQFIVMVQPILINEFMIHVQADMSYAKHRGILMTMAMKYVTAHCCRSRSIQPNLAYFLHPASCILGPWHELTLQDDEVIINKKKIFMDFLKQLRRYIITISMSFVINVFGNIVFLVNYQNTIYMPFLCHVYLTALEFRIGHYFACYLAMAHLQLWISPKSRKIKFCDILAVEIMPRSLASLVGSWNIPMHEWLKKYVFIPLNRTTHIRIVPILITYLVSCTLHGFKSPIWCALMSVGIFSFIEHLLRSKLADICSSCILTRSCKKNETGSCLKKHQNTTKSTFVLGVNFLFTLMVIFHLTYTSYVLNGNSEGDSDHTSIYQVRAMWTELSFISHWINISFILLIALITFRGS